MADSIEDFQTQMHAAVSEVVRKDDGAILGRWVLVAECIEQDGRRSTLTSCAPDQMAWESMGLLSMARGIENGALADLTFTDEAEDEDSDDG